MRDLLYNLGQVKHSTECA